MFGGYPPRVVRRFMGRGRITPDETIEQIKATYALNGNARETSRVLNVPLATVLKYVDPETKDEFDQVRSEKRVDIIAKAAEVQVKLLDAMAEPVSLARSSLQEKATAFGIVTDKILLITGQPNNRTHTTTDATATLTPEEMEQAAKIRERFASAELVPR